MYSAKSEGKARYALFDPGVQAEIASQMRLKAELGSVDMDNDLVIHYQPIVSLMAGNVSGAEALLRWSHPERGLLGPDLFIELAEETGAIVEIGAWVLREACKQATKWVADQPAGAFSVHVNLSARQLQHPSIVDQVTQALDDSGLKAENLVLEITESTVLSDWRAVGTQIARLREQGVLVALDDFGTGYSSLSYLQRFPVDILKIDRSFIRALTRDREGFRLTRAIIHLADTLQLITVAEGIETADQLAELNSIGCPLGQGFYLGEPLLPDDLTRLMQKSVPLTS
jgi:EAL domain-containing protein (putative c-di-GMP-specific phosphodiesterase class I)